MRTAIDSSVLLDVFGADPEFGEGSRVALRRAYDMGALMACEVVWAEVRAHFADAHSFERALSRMGVLFDPMTAEASEAAGMLWRDFCESHPRPRRRLMADFLVGAHALHQADALLSRDRGFYGESFQELQVLDPSSS